MAGARQHLGASGAPDRASAALRRDGHGSTRTGRGPGQAEEGVVVARVPRPPQRRPQVVMLALDDIQPGRIAVLGVAPFEQREEEPACAAAWRRPLAARFQPLQPELAHRLQHPEARLARRPLPLAAAGSCRPARRCTGETSRVPPGRRPPPPPPACSRRRRRPGGGRAPAPPRGEQVVAPGDGVRASSVGVPAGRAPPVSSGSAAPGA